MSLATLENPKLSNQSSKVQELVLKDDPIASRILATSPDRVSQMGLVHKLVMKDDPIASRIVSNDSKGRMA